MADTSQGVSLASLRLPRKYRAMTVGRMLSERDMATILAWHNAELARETKAARSKAIDDCIDVVRSKQSEDAQEIARRMAKLQSQPIAEQSGKGEGEGR